MTDAPDDPNQEPWFQNSWRPAMAWQYLVICLFDFMIAPIMMGFYSAYTGDFHAWDPLTIRGGGLYHLSMGAVVGVAVWSRGQEKMQTLNSGDDDKPKDDDKDKDKPCDNRAN
jgi:hypothetical protein